MENIRRSIKLFFAKYGNLILIFVLIIAGIILFLKLIDKIAEESYKRKEANRENVVISKNVNKDVSKNTETRKMEVQRNKNIIQDKKIIDQFLSSCKKNQEEAYNMLSDQCKLDKYQTFEDFKNYVDIIFEQTKDYKIEEQEQDGLYKILFYVEDILQAGSVENRKRFENFYYIEPNSSKAKKIYINYTN